MNARCAGILVLAAACSSGPPALVPSMDAGLPCGASAEIGGATIAVGAPAVVAPRLFVDCDGRGAAVHADEVVVEVRDPDDRLVPFTVGPIEREGGPLVFHVSAAIAFTPDRPGPWTVRARFEPAVGQVQLSVAAAVPHTDAGSRVVPVDTLPSDCIQFGLLASGTPVCLSGPFGGGLAVGSQTLSGESFAIDGDAIWVLAREQLVHRVRRFVPALGFTHSSEPVLASGPIILSVRNGEAIVAVPLNDPQGQQRITHLRPEPDGGLTVVQRPIGPRTVMALAPAEGRLVLSTLPTTGAAEHLVLADDGGARLTAGRLVSGFRASDEGLAWGDTGTILPGVGRHDISVLDFDGAQPRFRTTQYVGVGTRAPGLQPVTPVANFTRDGGPGLAGVLNVDGPDLAWDLYDLGPGFDGAISATRRQVFARSADGKTLKVIDR